MDIQFPQILFQIINFGVVTGVLTFLLIKPVQKMLNERSERIEEAQKAAQATLAERQSIEDMKKKARRQAEEESATLVEEATAAAAQRKKQLISEAKSEAMAEIAKMRQEWLDEKQSMMDSMKASFTDAVFVTVEKVIGEADKKTHQKLVDAELKELLKRI